MSKKLSDAEILKKIKEAIEAAIENGPTIKTYSLKQWKKEWFRFLMELSENVEIDEDMLFKLKFFPKNGARGKHIREISESTWQRYKCAKAFILEGDTVANSLSRANISNGCFYRVQKFDPNPLTSRRGKRAGVSQKMIDRYLYAIELRKQGLTVVKSIKAANISFRYFYLIRRLNPQPPKDKSVA